MSLNFPTATSNFIETYAFKGNPVSPVFAGSDQSRQSWQEPWTKNRLPFGSSASSPATTIRNLELSCLECWVLLSIVERWNMTNWTQAASRKKATAAPGLPMRPRELPGMRGTILLPLTLSSCLGQHVRIRMCLSESFGPGRIPFFFLELTEQPFWPKHWSGSGTNLSETQPPKDFGTRHPVFFVGLRKYWFGS